VKRPPEQGSAEFRLAEKFDVPELLGASWWLQSLTPTRDEERKGRGEKTRREALQRLLVIGGGVVAVVSITGLSYCGGGGGGQPARIDSTQLQRTKAWDWGAGAQKLQFADAVDRDVDGNRVDDRAIALLATQLRPRRLDLVPFYLPTLFQAAPQRTLAQAMVPICSDAMRRAFAAGAAVADLFAPDGAPRDVGLVVDLPGPEAVAFAAGASARFAPVFTFDDWPHPRGVVPAHRTLAAALYYRPRLNAPDPDPRRPMFVLDRARLSPYHDEPDRFDNRYLARLPNAPQLRALPVARALYVTPTDADEPLDDLDETLAAWRAGGIEVRMLGCDRFEPAPAPAPVDPAQPTQAQPTPSHYYGHAWGRPLFWQHYSWWPGAGRLQQPSSPPPPPPRGASFVPVAHPARTNALTGSRVGRIPDPDAPTSTSGGSWGRSRSRSFGG